MLIYKILRTEERERFDTTGLFDGAPVDLADGFIHFSAADQVAGTLAKHFADEAGLHLLACDTEHLGDALKWEVSRGGAQFPHLYRGLTRDDIVWMRPIDDQTLAALL